MKILHVTQGYTPAIGGTEALVQHLSEELVRNHGDQVTVFTTNCYSGEAFFTPSLPSLPVGWEEINGVRVRRFPVRRRVSRLFRWPQRIATRFGLPFNDYLRTLFGGPLIPGLAQAIREFPADIIAASSFPLMHMHVALDAAVKSQRPCVFYGALHPQDRWGFDRPMIYRAIGEATAYVAYTGFEAQRVVEQGIRPDHISVIGIGVDPKPFERISSVEAKRRLGLEGKPVVGFIGQLGAHKGVDTLVRAMSFVWQTVPEAHILIAGARTLFVDHLEGVIQRWPASDQAKLVRCYNFPEEAKPGLFGAADVIAYPSGYESFGISFLEAWASGKPVIGCKRGAVPWVVDAGRDGLLVNFQKDKELAEAIILLLKNPGWARVLGEAGRRKVLARYTWPEIARRFRQVYVHAIESTSHKPDAHRVSRPS